jgi:hypothetical protein
MAQEDAASKIPTGAANEESIPAGGEIATVYDPTDPFGLGAQYPAIGAAKTTLRRPRIKRRTREPLVKLDMPYLIDDPEPAPTLAEKLEDQGVGAAREGEVAPRTESSNTRETCSTAPPSEALIDAPTTGPGAESNAIPANSAEDAAAGGEYDSEPW